jgi:hypothetical protein
MDKKTNKSGSNLMKLAFVGAALADLAATAYFLIGPGGKQNRKYAKSWAIKMKGDVVEKLEKAQEISEPVYHQLIDSVSAKHEKSKNTDVKDVKALANDLKKHWDTISSAVKPIKKEIVKAAAKAVKKPIAGKKK